MADLPRLAPLLLVAALAAAACAPGGGASPGPGSPGAWRELFDGRTTQGWHVYGRRDATGWLVEDGTLVGLGSREGGDLVTDEEFEDFELSVEWRLSPGGNSGILYRVVEDPARYSATHATGPEYQLIDDDGYPAKLEEWQKTGANYAMHTATSRPVRPVGQWNESRVLVKGAHVEHWLNGVKVVEYDMGTPDWEERVRTGKWKDFPAYARARRGRIALQDHGNKVWFRNVRIRPL